MNLSTSNSNFRLCNIVCSEFLAALIPQFGYLLRAARTPLQFRTMKQRAFSSDYPGESV